MPIAEVVRNGNTVSRAMEVRVFRKEKQMETMQAVVVKGAEKLKRPPEPIFLSIKPERIQDPLEFAEVQERLAELPGWALLRGGTAVGRERVFATSQQAHTFARFVAELAGQEQQGLHVQVAGQRVTVELYGRRFGRRKVLTHAIFNFAYALG